VVRNTRYCLLAILQDGTTWSRSAGWSSVAAFP